MNRQTNKKLQSFSMKQSSQTSNNFDETLKFPIFAKSACGSRDSDSSNGKEIAGRKKFTGTCSRRSRAGCPERGHLGEGEGPPPGHPVRLSPFLPLPLLPELSAELRCCNSVPVVLFASPKPRAWFVFLSLTRISLPALRD